MQRPCGLSRESWRHRGTLVCCKPREAEWSGFEGGQRQTMQDSGLYPESSRKIMKGFKPGKGQNQPWAAPDLHRGSSLSEGGVLGHSFTTCRLLSPRGCSKSAHNSRPEAESKVSTFKGK